MNILSALSQRPSTTFELVRLEERLPPLVPPVPRCRAEEVDPGAASGAAPPFVVAFTALGLEEDAHFFGFLEGGVVGVSLETGSTITTI
jgi:hypothetical protein